MSKTRKSIHMCTHDDCGETFERDSDLEAHRQLHLRRQMDSGFLLSNKSPKLHGFTDQTPTPSKCFDDNLLKTPTSNGAHMANPFDQSFDAVSTEYDAGCW